MKQVRRNALSFATDERRQCDIHDLGSRRGEWTPNAVRRHVLVNCNAECARPLSGLLSDAVDSGLERRLPNSGQRRRHHNVWQIRCIKSASKQNRFLVCTATKFTIKSNRRTTLVNGYGGVCLAIVDFKYEFTAWWHADRLSIAARRGESGEFSEYIQSRFVLLRYLPQSLPFTATNHESEKYQS